MNKSTATELAKLESELEELLHGRRIEMARPMRGAERDRLRHEFERAEARLRARIADSSRPGGHPAGTAK